MEQDYSALIKDKQNVLSTYKLRMEQIRQEFIQKSSGFIQSLYDTIAKKYVTSEAETTLGLTKTKLKDLKSKVAKLKEDSQKIAQEVLLNQKLWWHIVTDNRLDYSVNSNKPPELLDKAVRLGLGKIGPVLFEFGYLKTEFTATSTPEMENWSPRDEHGYFFMDKGLIYPYEITWTEPMIKLIQEYHGLHTKARNLLIDINRLEKEEKGKQAEHLWDSA